MADYLIRVGVETEVDRGFLQGMANRMTVSYHKYGRVKDGYADGSVSAVKSLEQRLEKYLETGNTEYLMDVANFAMIEYMFPQVEGAHFSPSDSKDSPGRIRHDGRSIGSSQNLDVEPPK